MKTATHSIIHFFSGVRSRLRRIDWTSRDTHDAGIAVIALDNTHILHSSVIRMRSRLQSL